MQSKLRKQRRVINGLQSEPRKYNCRKLTRGRIQFREESIGTLAPSSSIKTKKGAITFFKGLFDPSWTRQLLKRNKQLLAS